MAVNKIWMGLRIGSDSGSDRTPDRIGSDRTGIFAFGAEKIITEKAVLTMTQVDRIFFFFRAARVKIM